MSLTLTGNISTTVENLNHNEAKAICVISEGKSVGYLLSHHFPYFFGFKLHKILRYLAGTHKPKSSKKQKHEIN